MMRLKGIAFLAIRILAVYVAVTGLIKLADFMYIAYQGRSFQLDEDQFIYMSAYHMAVSVMIFLMAFLLWRYAEPFAARILNRYAGADEETVPNIRSSNLYTLGLTLTGVVLFVTSLPAFIGSGVTLAAQYISTEFEMTLNSAAWTLWSTLLLQLLKLLLAVLLVARSHGIERLLDRIRGAGIAPSDPKRQDN